jgi:hypothetical protein
MNGDRRADNKNVRKIRLITGAGALIVIIFFWFGVYSFVKWVV